MSGSKKKYPSRQHRPVTSRGRNNKNKRIDADVDDSEYNFTGHNDDSGGVLARTGVAKQLEDATSGMDAIAVQEDGTQNRSREAPGRKRNRMKLKSTAPLASSGRVAGPNKPRIPRQKQRNNRHYLQNAAGKFSTRAPPPSVARTRPSNTSTQSLLGNLTITSATKKEPPPPDSWNRTNTKKQECIIDVTGDCKEVHREVQSGRDNRKMPPKATNSHTEYAPHPSNRNNNAQRTSDIDDRQRKASKQSTSDGNYMVAVQKTTDSRDKEDSHQRRKRPHEEQQEEVVSVDDDEQDDHDRTQAQSAQSRMSRQNKQHQKPAARAIKCNESSNPTWFGVDEDDESPWHTDNGTSAATKNAKGTKQRRTSKPKLPEIKQHKRSHPIYAQNTSQQVLSQTIPRKSNNKESSQPANLIAAAQERTGESARRQGDHSNGYRSGDVDNQNRSKLLFRKVNGKKGSPGAWRFLLLSL